jgi:hypothetical protein
VLMSVLLFVGLGVGIASAAGARIYVANVVCVGRAYKPRTITIACGDGQFFAAHLRYKSYGRAFASAAGKLVENDCTPSCAGGRDISYPGRIRLSRIEKCDGGSYYERISWTFTGVSPNPSPRGSVTIKPQAVRGGVVPPWVTVPASPPRTSSLS